MAATFEQIQQFIELRAEDVSYAEIAKQIKVSKTILIGRGERTRTFDLRVPNAAR